MKKLISCLSIVLFLVTSCNSSRDSDPYRIKDREDAPIQVSMEPQDGVFIFSEHFSSGELIRLSGCRVSNIEQVLPLPDGRFAIRGKVYSPSESSMTACVSLFSATGSLESMLVKVGNGPEEVVNAFDARYNPEKGTIDVLASHGKEIVRYDLSTFRKSSVTPVDDKEIVVAGGIQPVGGGEMLVYKDMSYSGGKEYKVYLCDAMSGRILDRFLPLNKQVAELLSHFDHKNNVSMAGEAAYFTEIYLPIVYRFDGESLRPFVGYRENKYSFPSDILIESGDDMMVLDRMARESGRIFFHTNYFLTAKHIYSTFQVGERVPYLNVICPEASTSRSYNEIKDDLCTGITRKCKDFAFRMVGSDDEYLFYMLDMEEEDNPVLLKLKE